MTYEQARTEIKAAMDAASAVPWLDDDQRAKTAYEAGWLLSKASMLLCQNEELKRQLKAAALGPLEKL